VANVTTGHFFKSAVSQPFWACSTLQKRNIFSDIQWQTHGNLPQGLMTF